MSQNSVLIDANLLVLLVVGATSKRYIEKHKKLSAFSERDYEELVGILSRAPSVLITPGILAETSNLATCIAEPAKSEILNVIRGFVGRAEEIHISGEKAVSSELFIRLGYTDSAILEASAGGRVLLTTDLGLYLAALEKGLQAINFNHLREQYL